MKLENHKILWNLVLDFSDDNNNVLNTIIFVWENWAWKSTLMNVIFQFSNFDIIREWNNNEKRIFEVQFSDYEMEKINNNKLSQWLQNIELSNLFEFTFDLSISKENWNQVKIVNKLNDNIITNWLFHQSETKPLFKSIFSDVSINFSPKNISSTTNIDTDSDVKTSMKSNENLSTEITQMLVDIRAKDNEEQIRWQEINNKLAPKSLREVRTQRFKKAFNIIFKNKLKYSWVENLEPIFTKWNDIIKINNISSWEKQIVFRWSYLLKDKESIKWAIVLVDEPEISLHPTWQQNILNFYKRLFTNDLWKQTSQIFITTHSPYLLENCNFDDTWLYIFPDWKRLKELPVYSWKHPSLWVINYFVYNLISIELHIELYDYLKSKKWYNNKWLLQFDKDFFINDIWLAKNYPRYSKNNHISLHTHIRNVIHHWDSIIEPDFKNLLIKSIKWMIKIANNLT